MSDHHDGKHSSKKMTKLASKVLHDKEAEKQSKSLAGSVLSQAESHHDEDEAARKSAKTNH